MPDLHGGALNVLDLFAGLGGWSLPARERGHDVCTVDWDEDFAPDICTDIRTLTADMLPWRPDVILASPPCTTFTLMTVGKHWTSEGDWPSNQPRSRPARIALQLVAATLALIDDTRPSAWVMENPVGKLRKLDVMRGRERRTVTYCRFGTPFRKQTDLWGGFPPSLELPEPCHNVDPCHISAPRGSRRGIQGAWIGDAAMMFNDDMRGTSRSHKQLAALRAKVPRRLAEQVLDACERDTLQGTHPRT